MQPDQDVVVVGGGPVGLTLACELRLAGLEVEVIERRAGRVSQSRALTIHGRTLEMLDLRGLAGRFTPRGIPLPSGHFAALDTRLDFSVFETRFPITLFLPQTLTEELLEQRARELGVRLRPGAVVEHTEQSPDGITVRGLDGNLPFQRTARYLVGADGGRSLVRQQAGIAFPGVPATTTSILGDVRLDTPQPIKPFSTVNAAGLIMIAPLGDGVHHRIVLIDADRCTTPLAEPVTLEELAASTRKISGRDLGLRAPLWLSRFSDETRLASSYRNGRIFLAGDAAHIHMPAGGQGMNVGMQDAMNLGWKLAGALNGLAPDTLLDTYHRERHPVGASLYRNTLAQTALMTSFDPRGLALRETMNDLLHLPTLNRTLADQLSGFGITYPAPLSAVAPGTKLAPGWTGRRVPSWPLRLADGTTTSLYTLLHQGKWLLLQLDGSAGNAPEVALDPRWMRVVQATPESACPELDEVAAILVRPDGYADHAIAKD